MMNTKKVIEISHNPKFKQLVKTRSRYSWCLTLIMLTMYFGFIFLVAFNKDLLAKPLGAGVTTLSIPIGLGLIAFTVAITGLYVRRANTEFDDLTQEILKETK
jgi:uncharacterized membrane protein (DUF485 family)